jgi:hypothetical protein
LLPSVTLLVIQYRTIVKIIKKKYITFLSLYGKIRQSQYAVVRAAFCGCRQNADAATGCQGQT